MSHAHEGPAVSLRISVITVSSTRSLVEDRSGDLLVERAEGAGHVVTRRMLVKDGRDSVGAAFLEALSAGDVDVVLLTGGTGVSARDVTADVVRRGLARELRGFGELFRMLSWQEVGAAAMLSDAIGGTAIGADGRARLVFAMPGSTNACRLAMDALILPELGHLARELSKEAPEGEPVVPEVEAPERVVARPPRGGVQVEAAPPPVLPPVASPSGGVGWRAAVESLGGTFAAGAPFSLPEALARVPAAHDVLASAGERASLTLPSGVRLVLFGFPDLSRPNAKVLAVAEGEGDAVEVCALHRWPMRVGLCGEGPLLPTVADDPAREAVHRTGAAPAVPGDLFAVETATIHLRHGRKVLRWDGRRPQGEQPANTALGSLLLGFSQR
jgi:molybdenum cofactor biosynthesis protein B